MGIIIAISNQKGGVGKSTSAFNLGACLALKQGKRVLLQSIEALTQLVKANTNPKLNLIGVLPTMVDRTKVSRTAIETLNEKYGEMLFRTSISKSIEAAKSSENGTPLCLTGHKLGQEYDELAQEVLSRC